MSQKKLHKEFESTIKSQNKLRDLLFSEMILLSEGKSHHKKSRAMASLSNQILESIRVEIEAHRYFVDQELKGVLKLPGMQLINTEPDTLSQDDLDSLNKAFTKNRRR